MLIPEDAANGRSEAECMDAMQQRGRIISDNCIDWDEVGNKTEAIAWLRANPNKH